jgi:rhamnose utilization protein RhaD (predicted bifunctional aldolase and dehydrogenase)/NAD(P)-dependent dehydrogenase (short-subunit alcohol dehydrogenase family)
MVSALRSQMLEPSGPTPSVEALLHAHLPGKFVDHTHAGAVLTIVDQPDAAARVRELWGDDVCFLPYVMPGFVLAKRVYELGIDEASPPLLILEKHGIFTWGRTAAESYERMISAVSAAEQYIERRRRSVALAVSIPDAQSRRAARLALQPVLRGALARREGNVRIVADWRDGPDALRFSADELSPRIAARGCITPDHVIRTKPFAAWIDAPGRTDAVDGDDLQRRVDASLDQFGQRYSEYFSAYSGRSAAPLTRLDLLPRVVVVPGLGIAGLGKTRAQARIAADLYEQAITVMTAAEAIGAYQPVSHADLFDVEYWSLEQAKLGGVRSEPALTGAIALVTGAASGIGLATAAHFVSLGAHLMMVDRDAAALEVAAATLQRRHGGAVQAYVADLTDPSSARQAVEAATLAFGGLDCVVSNAGSAPSGPLHGSEGNVLLSRSIEMNLLSHQYVAQSAADVFVRQGMGGCLLFNASKSAFNPGPLFGPYAVAKAGLVALMKQYAIDLAPFGVRANAVNADRVRTGLFSAELLESRAKARGVSTDAYFKSNLLGRETLADDVARAFGYLATAAATTGAVIPVDGGNPAAFPR